MDFSLFRAGHKVQRGASRWMLYFMAMLGSASGQETLLDYWFLWGDEKAASRGGDASRVIRVEGAKGEHYVPVYEKLHSHPLVAQARAGLNARRRQEALKLSRQYRDAGMSPEAAYEKAWAEVYQRFRSQSSKEEAKETLLQLVARTQAAGAGVSANDAAVQHVLQLLVLHEELLATAEARELLDYLSRQQLIFEKEALLAEPGTNDALMGLFADAMEHGMKGANAFRDAQFKLNRERIIHHELTGYLAPWGAGMGGRISYRQAPRRKVIAATTLGSGTLKDTLPDEDEKKKQQEQEEEKKVTSTSGEAENNGPQPVYMGPLSSGGDGPMRFTMMRAAAPEAGSPEAGEISDYTYTWNGAGTNNIWSAAGSAENSAWGNQTASGNTPGVYENGNQVVFGDSATGRDVSISGVVAPGLITVNANTEPASSGTGDAILNYGYAFTGNGSIADYSDSVRTSIDVKGNALLILNTVNTFSGGITMADGASVYLGRDHAAGTGTINMGANSTLYVNYRSDDLSFRSPALSNALVIAGETAIRTGTGSYGEDRMPSDWRTLTLSGGISGSGTLSLYGYSYLIKPTQYEDRLVSFNYVSAFAINERDAVVAGGGTPDRFTGTVYLKNEFNDRPDNVQEIPVDKNKILAGALQLTLVDDVFSVAVLDLTRDESTTRTAGHNQGQTGKSGNPSTSDNILVLSENSQIRIKALDAKFLGHGFKLNYRDNNASSYVAITAHITDYKQMDERWLVRVVADGTTNLVLEDNANTVHQFAGSMGFAHSYTALGQSHIYAAGGPSKKNSNDAAVAEPSEPGGGSVGVESLSLEKRGQSTQYIHTANLQDLSVLGGTAGFNYLNLSGDLNMVSGSKLQLATATYSATGWESISGTSYDSTDTVTVTGGNRVSVVTLPGGNTDPAAIAGGLTMAEGSSLNFEIQSLSPSADSSLPHLQISGALTMQYDTPVSVSITNADFAQTAGTTKYYLAGAGSLSVLDGTKNAKFQSQLIPLGYGYYGTVFVEGNYLVLTVDGDPRRTWSGMVKYDSTDATSARKAYGWYTTAYTAEQIKADQISMDPDKRWKENCIFQDAQVVMFGNLYEPMEWEADTSLLSSQTVIVNGSDDKLHDGTLVGETEEGIAGSQIFQIDDVSLVSLGTGEDADRTLGYQAVKISGEVAPLSVVINSKFTKVLSDGSSKLEDDDTNYFFYGDGCIADADEISLGVTDFDQFDQDWKTNLRKTGLGTAVIATKNTYSGGTVIEGGRLVMQNIHALGKGSITMQNVSDKGVNIPVLQGDFSDTDKSTKDWAGRIDSDNLSAYQGEGMDTTTIHNPVNVVLPSGIGGGVNTSRVDARIANAHDKKLVLKELKGDVGTVLTLYGTSLAEDAANHHGGMYTYAVFKVLDPSEFYGTIKMDGNLWGKAEGTPGGNVQMEIMTTAKSATGADWLHTTVDLSVENGTTRTVLALDALGTDGADLQQTAQVDSLNGTGNSGGCMNSSVLSMSHEKKITLELEGLVAGNYDGVLGFGDFQKTVDYGKSSDVAIGAVAHHYGGRGKEGELSVRKLGNTTQSVNSAWLNRLTVGYRLAEGKESADADGEVATAGGAFVVDEALVVSELKIADGMHTVVGQLGSSSTHALTVGAGGILAFEQTGKDAFNGIGAGIAKQTKEEINGENITIKEIAPENFVLLADGSRFLHTATGIRIGSELKASMELQLLLKWGLILRALQR
ncbi:MAG: autotransporter-associated beta strand repeat-containing protein [Akkermansia sp.]|nr:autotransporter-associated beta strand repeat-containing protein [Akkermansia sp.]